MKKTIIICVALALAALAAPAWAAMYVFQFDGSGQVISMSRYDAAPYPKVQSGGLVWVSQDDAIGRADDIRRVKATIQGDQVVGVALDPTWTPPAPAPDPLDELRSLVRGNILASDHDKRWLAQKEAAKAIAIPWIKANPTATQAEFQNAVFAALVDELPTGEPIVVNPGGIIASYALAAKERGLIAEATFIALRDFVVATTEKKLAKLLAQL
jgi:hypothetical protein